MKHIVVFDGTSAYVIPEDELQNEIEVNEVSVISEHFDIDEAQECADDVNVQSSDMFSHNER